MGTLDNIISRDTNVDGSTPSNQAEMGGLDDLMNPQALVTDDFNILVDNALNKIDSNRDLRVFRGSIEELKTLPINEGNKNTLTLILNNFLSSSNTSELLSFIQKIQELTLIYRTDVSQTQVTTREGEEEVLREVQENSALSADEIKRVTGIDIYGSGSPEEIIQQILAFTGELGEKLSVEERDIITEQLQKIVEAQKDMESIGYSHIEDYFDQLAQSVEERGGSYIIQLGEGETKVFSKKQEALDFIIGLKNEAESHFQGGLRNVLEVALGAAFGPIWALEKIVWKNIPGRLFLGAANFAGLHLDPLDWMASVALFMAGVATTAVLVGMHSGVVESIYRRTIKDGILKANSANRMSDYARNGATRPVDINTPEGQDYMEFKQRQQIVDLLWSDLEMNETPGSEEYKKRVAQIQKIDGFKLNRTPTFYYLAFKYTKVSGRLRSLGFTLNSIFLRGSRTYYLWPQVAKDAKIIEWVKFKNLRLRSYTISEDSKALANKTIDHLLGKGSVQEGIDLFYKNNKVESTSSNNETPRLTVEGPDTKTAKFQHIIDEINSRNITSGKKAKLIENFTDYVSKLKEFPKGKEVIARDLYFLLDTDFGKNKDFSDILKLRIDKLQSDIGISNTINSRLMWTQLYRFRKFKELIDNGEWIGSKDELDIEIRKLETQKGYKVLSNYSSKVGSVDFSVRLTEIIQHGKDASIGRRALLGDFFDIDRIGNDFESSRKHATGLLKRLYEYVDFGIHDNNLEKFANQELRDFFDAFISGKIGTLDEKILYGEIRGITQGYLPSYKLIDSISKLIDNNKSHPSIINLRDLLSRAQRNSINLTPDDLQRLTRNLDSFDFIVNRTRTIPDTIKDDFGIEIDRYKGWADADFNRSLRTAHSLSESPHASDYYNALQEKYKGELSSLRILDTINGNTGNSAERLQILTELQKFSQALVDNKYSEGQADDILRRIFNGEMFDSITLLDEKNAASFYDGKTDFSRRVEATWNSLTDSERVSRAGDILIDLDINTETLPPQIKRSIDDARGATELQELITKNTARLQLFIDQVNSINTPSRLNILITQFNTYIDNSENKIVVDSPEYQSLITDFQELIEAREKVVGTPVERPIISDPIEEERRTTPEEVVEDSSSPKTGSEYLGRNSNWGRGYDAFMLEVRMHPDINIIPNEFFTDILSQKFESREALFTAMNEKLSIEEIDLQIISMSQDEHLNFQRAYAEDIYTRDALSRGINVDDMVLNSLKSSPKPLDSLNSINFDTLASWDDIEIPDSIPSDDIDSLRDIRRGSWRNDAGTKWRTILENIRKAST